MKIEQIIGVPFHLTFNCRTGRIERGECSQSALDAGVNDGVYEVLRDDLSLRLFKLANGKIRELTSGQAIRLVLDGAGRDPKSGKRRDASKAKDRRRAAIEDVVWDALDRVLRTSSNGTTLGVDLVRKPGSPVSAETTKVKVGEYRGDHKGYAIWGTKHAVAGSLDDAVGALLAIGQTVIEDLVPLRAEPIQAWAVAEDGQSVQIVKLTAVRQGRSGAEVVERFVLPDSEGLLVAKTAIGAKSALRNRIQGRKDIAAAEVERLRRMEQIRQEEEQRCMERVQQAQSARFLAGIDDDDADAIGLLD